MIWNLEQSSFTLRNSDWKQILFVVWKTEKWVFIHENIFSPARNMFNVHPERDPRDDDKKDGRDVRLDLKYNDHFDKMKHNKSSILGIEAWIFNSLRAYSP